MTLILSYSLSGAIITSDLAFHLIVVEFAMETVPNALRWWTRTLMTGVRKVREKITITIFREDVISALGVFHAVGFCGRRKSGENYSKTNPTYDAQPESNRRAVTLVGDRVPSPKRYRCSPNTPPCLLILRYSFWHWDALHTRAWISKLIPWFCRAWAFFKLLSALINFQLNYISSLQSQELTTRTLCVRLQRDQKIYGCLKRLLIKII